MNEQICRLCMSEETNMVSILDEDRNIPTKTKICLNIEIQLDDNLPKKLCEECLSLLDGYYQFYMQCQETNKALRQLKEDANIQFRVIKFEILSTPDEPIQQEIASPTKETAICDICMFKTDSLEALNFHQLSVHVGEAEESVVLDFKCDHCGKLFLNEAARKEHLRYSCPFMDTRSYICDLCNKSFKEKQTLRKHLNLHMKVKEYPCKHCDKIYYSQSSLILHYRSHSSEPCPVCHKVLKSYSLPYHMAQHSTETRFQCPICNKIKFPTESSLKQHLKIHTKSAEPTESLICDCGRKFKSLRGKQCHKANGCPAVSLDNFTFKCETCGKGFSKKSNLSRHMSSHDEKSYKWKCGICGKKFNNSSNYKVHKYSHNPEKNIPCKYCDKMFKNQDSLRSHYVLHEGKLFSCRVCEKTFGTITLLNNHVKKKHENEIKTEKNYS
ncbi:zinc finger protein 708-like [Culicoides brevitarsis]|uniref:zinc finger protein 708-like n=1 Tax=Culicoides brevitarsis TaxID=469753 RepID=UPI00307B1320